MNPATVNQNVKQAQASGQARQQALDTQSGQLQGQYSQATGQANTAYQNATNAANAIQSGGDLYGKYLKAQQDSVGFNPADLTTANKNLTAIQNQVAYAPTAAQQSGNYYGTTAGGTTNIYSGLMQNLNPGLTNATNAAGNLTNEYGQLTNAANQQTGSELTSEQNKATDLAGVYAQAVNQMQVSGTTMAAIQKQAQDQGYVTAQTVAEYQNAYSTYLQAQAAQTSAAAAMTTATAGARLTNLQSDAQQASNAKAQALASQQASQNQSMFNPNTPGLSSFTQTSSKPKSGGIGSPFSLFGI